MSTLDIAGQTILITGASSGIGTGYARAFAQREANLVLVARRGEALRTLAAELTTQYGVKAEVVELDLTSPGATETLIGLHPQIDGLVNNAGFGTSGVLQEQDAARIHQEIQLNCGVLVDLTRAYLPGMLERQRGTIINVASTAAFQPIPGMAVYGATKAFVLSFTQALWGEVQRNPGNQENNIRVLAICPGATSTEFFDTAGANAAVGRMRSVDQVVATTFRGLERNQHSTVDGLANRILAQFARLAPRNLVIPVVQRMMRG
ncbi:SDR family NAD(P)-dependent oxidoreductase [Psychromicrobium xiongbiense]|uniref:SDR family NAD(P)-dependent oxidoreductase n=1 Tax=Psychromicrobium xiongbiense TaxID=3051184 RepID=UPI002553AF37|nr:SDR family oxidoreductase [Psychromicrobium sp. YIM S02556]